MSDGQTRSLNDHSREARIGRILDDFLTRRARGERVSDTELLAQHPDLADELREHLGLLGELRPPGDRIKALIAQGILTPCDEPAASGQHSHLAELGTYKILDFLGRGGMGIVLKAHEASLNRTVALKILRPELSGDRVALERFTREAKAAAALNHPNIVSVYAVGEERNTHYLAMEYVAGPSLAEAIRESYQPSAGGVNRQDAKNAKEIRNGDQATAAQSGSEATRQPGNEAATRSSRIVNRQASIVNPEVVRHIFHQLLEALAVAHEAGLIHRDVKSSNILLECGSRNADCGLKAPEGAPLCAADSTIRTPQSAIPESRTPDPEPSASVKLADFGLARMITAQTRVTLGDSILGTPEYMSPEQACGDSEIDHRSDLYSAGVVLYEMLTGRTPFRADTPSAVIHQILNVAPPEPRMFNRDVDPVLASLALRLMAKDPEDRFASAGEMLAALDAGERVRSPQRWRRARSRLARAGLAAAALLVIVGVVSYFFLRTPIISEVSIGSDGRTVQFLYTGDSESTRVHRFPQDVKRICDHALLDVNGSGRQIVAVGLDRPLQNGTNVIALDIRGEELWPLDLSNHPQVESWPGCATADYWPCDVLASAQLDNAPGEELIAVARDNHEYPTRLSIIDPRPPTILSNFWHTGQISSIQVVPDFFDGQRPAILAWGYNNRLRPIPRGSSDDLEETAQWDVVMALMILDPARLVKQPDGLGPHGLDSHHALVDAIVPAPVHAYAFVGVPDGPATGASLPRAAKSATRIGIMAVDRRLPPTGEDTGDWFTVSINQPAEPDDVQHTAMLVVDHNLQLQEVILSDGENTTPAFWRQYWHLVIQNAEYVEK